MQKYAKPLSRQNRVNCRTFFENLLLDQFYHVFLKDSEILPLQSQFLSQTKLQIE